MSEPRPDRTTRQLLRALVIIALALLLLVGAFFTFVYRAWMTYGGY